MKWKSYLHCNIIEKNNSYLKPTGLIIKLLQSCSDEAHYNAGNKYESTLFAFMIVHNSIHELKKNKIDPGVLQLIGIPLFHGLSKGCNRNILH